MQIIYASIIVLIYSLFLVFITLFISKKLFYQAFKDEKKVEYAKIMKEIAVMFEQEEQPKAKVKVVKGKKKSKKEIKLEMPNYNEALSEEFK